MKREDERSDLSAIAHAMASRCVGMNPPGSSIVVIVFERLGGVGYASNGDDGDVAEMLSGLASRLELLARAGDERTGN